MYSKEIEEVLSKKKISQGDQIKFTSNKRSFEGILIPKSEFGDPDSLIVKLSNGYNIGIKFRKGDRIERIAGRREAFSFPKAELGNRRNLPKVTIVATGGTIGSTVDYATGGVTALVAQEELLYQIPELQNIADFQIISPVRMMSEDLSYKDWQEIARAVAKALSNSHGVIVTHGTDTMNYTAAALSFMLHGLNGPVVLTGSQRSPDRGSSDAFMNLICAAHIAAKSDVAEVGICMHATSSDNYCNFMRGTKVRKMHATKRDAFKPINSKPIARVSIEGKIEYMDEDRKKIVKSSDLKLMPGYEPKVALVKFYPNSDPEIIDFYVSKGYKGLIIEGTGMGHVAVSPRDGENSWIAHIKRAVNAGMVVGMTSQTLSGRVNPNVYTNGRLISKAGAIYCEDMLPEVALVKLGVLLGNYRRVEAAKMLNKNIVGEITKRTEVDWFM